jgi:hypothetical protein
MLLQLASEDIGQLTYIQQGVARAACCISRSLLPLQPPADGFARAPAALKPDFAHFLTTFVSIMG